MYLLQVEVWCFQNKHLWGYCQTVTLKKVCNELQCLTKKLEKSQTLNFEYGGIESLLDRHGHAAPRDALRASRH